MVQARTHAQEVEEALNLKRQLNILDDVSDQDMVFQVTSPPKRWDTVYSLATGEPIRVARHRLIDTLNKRNVDGSQMFTANKALAPEYRLGTVKCFLAKGSAEREAVDTLNIAPGYYCPAEHLDNDMAATLHAEKTHKTRWRLFKEWKDRQEREADKERQNAQIHAILKLAQVGREEE